LQACASSVVDRLDMACAQIWQRDESSAAFEIRASAGLHLQLDDDHIRTASGIVEVGPIVSSRRSHVTNDVVNDPAITDVDWFERHGLVAFAGYPLLLGGSVLGVLGAFANRPLAEESVAALHAVADILAVGLQRLANDEALRMAAELARTLLPRHLPSVPGAEAAGQYRPASDRDRVGGDWYDATTLPDGTVAFTVGDVAGHDLRSSATMGRLRHAVQLYALDGCPPAEALSRVDRLMRRAGIVQTATVVHSVYDPATRVLTLCRAGHPSPVVIRADGSARWPEPTAYGGRLLGAGRCEDRSTLDMQLDSGDTVVFFTDGLVERPGEYFDRGIERLVAAATAGRVRSADDLCQHLVAELLDPEVRDDVVVLVLRVF